MRILFFVQSLNQGGPERNVSDLARGLARRGHHVALAALHTLGNGWRQVLDTSSLPVSIFFRDNPGNALSAGSQLVRAAHTLRHLLQSEGFGILYCTAGPVPPAVGWLATAHLPAVRLVWSVLATPGRPSRQENFRSWLLWRFRVLVSPSVPLQISVSKAAQEGARAQGYRCQRECVIYPGVDVESFRPDPAGRALLRGDWGVTSEKKLIGLVGRLDPVKGHPVFLEAARILAAKGTDLVFVCVGDGPEPYSRQLRQLGAELGLGERLIWAGSRAYGDMRNVYSALDLLCLPSRSEGLPNVIAEAMACGVSCVASQVGGVPEILGDLGIMVPPGDPAALARGVLEGLAVNPGPDELRRHIITGFGIGATVEATERELEALALSGQAV